MHSNNRRASRPRPRPRSSFVVTFGAAAILGACGGSTVGDPAGNPSDASDDGGGNPSGCPASAPTAAAMSCALPNNTTCTYGGGCNPDVYTCEGGQWAHPISNPPRPVCPPTEPTPGTTCDPCSYPSTLHCPYPIGICQGQPIDGEVDCIGGKWQLMGGGSCNPPAATDAGWPADASALPDATAPRDAGVD